MQRIAIKDSTKMLGLVRPGDNSFIICPACMSSRHAGGQKLYLREYKQHRCVDCGLLFSDPMRAADSTWYSSSWLYDMRVSEGGWRHESTRIPWHFAQALSVLPRLPGATLLDVGCAEGQFLHLAQNAGFDVTGVDFNPVGLKVAREVFGISSIYQCSVEEIQQRFPNIQFDVITLFEVLEHTADPTQVIESIRNVLKPGGRFLLSVPGSRRWPRFFNPVVDVPPHHLTLWTKEALKRILERGGFRVISIGAKPLGADDLGLHLKWRLRGALRKLRATKCGGRIAQNVVVDLRRDTRYRASQRRITRELAWTALKPLCWALRTYPSAGGFTLFAHCEYA